MSWFYISLVCALSLAFSDAFSKRYFPNYSGESLLIIRLSLPGLALLPLTLYSGLPDVPAEFWYLLMLSVPLEILAMLLYVIAIRDDALHLTLPFLAFTPVFVILTGYLFLGETVSLNGALGIFLIVTGAYILNMNTIKSSWKSWLAPIMAIFRVRGSVFMLLVAGIYSITSVISKRAMLFTTPETFGAFYYSLVGVTTLVVILVKQPSAVKNVLKRTGAALLVSFFMAIMVVTHFIAISMVEVSYMLAVKRTSMIFGMLMGAWMFHDMSYRQHLPAGLLMLLGVILILT